MPAIILNLLLFFDRSMENIKHKVDAIMFQLSELKKVEISSSVCSGAKFVPRPSLENRARFLTLRECQVHSPTKSGEDGLKMSTKREKRKQSDEQSESGRDHKKRETGGDKAKSRDRPQFIRVQLSDNTRKLAGLTSPELLCIHHVRYVSDIANDFSYLYDIVSRVLETKEDAVKLYVQKDGRSRPEAADEGWMAVEKHDEIEGGNFLCIVREGISPYHVETNHRFTETYLRRSCAHISWR